MWDIALLVLLGFLVGFVAAFLGIGGGVLFVPILVLAFGFDMRHAVGTSLLAVFITSISSFVAYYREGKVRFKLGLLLDSASVPGALLGAYFTTLVPTYVLKWLFACFLLIMAFRIVTPHGASKPPTSELKGYGFSRLTIALMLAFLAGFLSASLGIGGGVLKVPIMVTALRVPIHYAAGTSVFMIVITSGFGLLEHYFLGHVVVFYGLALGLGSVFGAQLGAWVSLRTKPRRIRFIFAGILTIIAVRMILGF